MAPLVKALQAEVGVEGRVCVTAQHRQMLDQVLELFEIVPDHDLNVMRPGQDLYTLTSEALQSIDHSTGNLIENNRFEQFAGSPVRIWAESDYNRIVSNKFAEPVYAVSQWYCNEASAACREKAERGRTECPSVGTEIIGNRIVGDLGLYAHQSQSKRAACVWQGLRAGQGIEPRMQGNSAIP